MSNRWQMQGSYVWSRLDGDILLDYTNPNNLIDFVGKGSTTTGGIGNTISPDQPHAFKLLGSYQAPWGVTLGANYQAVSGLARDRNLSVPFSQGTANFRVEPRGTYRGDTLSLLSVRADKSFRLGGGSRASFIAELHNALNSSAGQAAAASSYGSGTRRLARPTAVHAARLGTASFCPVAGMLCPRRAEIGGECGFLFGKRGIG